MFQIRQFPAPQNAANSKEGTEQDISRKPKGKKSSKNSAPYVKWQENPETVPRLQSDVPWQTAPLDQLCTGDAVWRCLEMFGDVGVEG